MPFDSNISSNSTGAIRDYSTYENNGTLGGGNTSRTPNWTSDGKISGAYVFDGEDDYIALADSHSLDSISDGGTFSFWINASNCAHGTILDKSDGNNQWGSNGFVLRLSTSNTLYYRTQYSQATYSSDNICNEDVWIYVAMTFDTTGVTYYKNGAQYGSKDTDHTQLPGLNDETLKIGVTDGFSYYFNGSIDEVKIYNRSLSPEQIKANYLAGLANHSTETIVQNETKKGETWTVAVTPNDIYDDGTTQTSNTLYITITEPTVTLKNPATDWVTNSDPYFKCSASSDVDLNNIIQKDLGKIGE